MDRAEDVRIPQGAALAGELAAIRALPGFETAARHYAAGLLGMYESHPLLNRFISELSLFMIDGFALYLHAARDPGDPRSGLTLGRLQELCATHGYASPGRVAALFALMRFGKLVEPVPTGDRRLRRFVPTNAWIARTKTWWAHHLRLVELARPDRRYLDRLSSDPDYHWALRRQSGRAYFAGERHVEMLPEIRYFIEPNAGFMILMVLVSGGGAGAFLSDAPLALSFTDIGRQLGVSRTHVRKVLEGAEARGHLTISRGSAPSVQLSLALIEAYRDWVAISIASFDRVGRAAMAEADRARDAAGDRGAGGGDRQSVTFT